MAFLTKLLRGGFLALLVCGCLQAVQKYALIIGIGRYLPGQELADLDGPGPDADAIKSALIADYGFPERNVHVLRDAQASRAAVLTALDELIDRVALGDYVLIYYSGHGTSPQDPASRSLPIDGDTGALIPADFRRGTSQEVAARLVIGRRDLRPRLMRLDGKATVFGILDTCFSANLMKSVRVRGTPKGVPVGQLLLKRSSSMEEEIRQDVENMAKAPPPETYPYHTVAWISAALAGQQAVDIDSATVERDPKATIDGLPHGELTNALLRGLRGQADLNHDGTITHMELYEYLLRQSMTWSHQPAWSADESNRQLPAMPILGGRTIPLDTLAQPGASGDPRVQLEGASSGLRARISKIPHVTVVESDGDLVVRPEGGGYRIYQPGGLPINDAPVDAEGAIGRIAAEPDVRRLVAWSYPGPRTSIEMAVFEEEQRTHKGFFLVGNQFDLKLRTGVQTWPLVLDVDVTGHVTVLYPNKQEGGEAPVTPGDFRNLGRDVASCPCGIDFLKAFAFEKKPADYDSWVGRSFAATDPLLKRILDLAKKGVAETALRLITNSKN